MKSISTLSNYQKWIVKYCLFILFAFTNCTNPTLFRQLDADKTGIDFANNLTESETQNILAYEYFYNGGGVAAADFNKDGFTDLFFTGNQVPNKLYLNKGSEKPFEFEDISKKAGIEGRPNGWKTGVAVADVNADGWLDIYVCYSGNGLPESRKNQLFINNGKLATHPSGGSFTEQAEEYGIADVGYSTHATFFDYDLDGDLDLFVLNHNLKGYQRKEAAYMKSEIDPYAGDRLYRNESLLGRKSLVVSRESLLSQESRVVSRESLLSHESRVVSPESLVVSRESNDPRAERRPPKTQDSKPTTKFKDITVEAGIKSNALGFGLGVVVSDFNHDNWPDLYVANDYVEEDYFYFNNGNGTFSERGKEVMGHFSYSAMGVDAADVNNDAAPDLFTCDMLPEDSRRQKLLAFPDNWNVQKSMLENGFHWQNMRNMLQINELVVSGRRAARESLVVSNHNSQLKTQKRFAARSQLTTSFQELGQLAGISNTDWSWAPVFADFDNDGNKDLFITNGFVKDLTDLDFVKYQSEQGNIGSIPLLEQLKKMPSTPTHHYIFKNNGDLTFSNEVKNWGFEKSTVASGAVYVDLDNDGDLDLVTNNTNEPAHVYKNTQQETKPQTFLKIKLDGTSSFGSKVWVYTNHTLQYAEYQPTHGFQSSIVAPLHFGFGNVKTIDSVRVRWNDGTIQLIKNPKINTTLTPTPYSPTSYTSTPYTFKPYTYTPYTSPTPFSLFNYTHQENLNIDFNRQILLPRLYSRNGPKMAVGDVNADGLEDVYVCGAVNQAGQLFLQKSDATFTQNPQPVFVKDATSEDCDAIFFDADGDKDLDLYVVSGGYEQALEDPLLQDRLYLNDGKGHFMNGILPKIFTNKSCVKALDYDLDGDLDLFLGGSVQPSRFPMSEKSCLLSNDGKGNFTKVSDWDLGIVTDAAIADINGDKFPEIITTAEWKPVQVLENVEVDSPQSIVDSGQPSVPESKIENQESKIKNRQFQITQSPNHSITQSLGFFSRIKVADLDNDGDTDFVVGNIGLNTPFHINQEKPLKLYYADFDKNGSIDPYMTYFFEDKSYPAAGRDEALEQVVSLRKKFTDYKSYSLSSIEDIFGKDVIENTPQLTINEAKSGILINNKGILEWKTLPMEAQVAPVYAIEVADFNKDGKLDILLGGNNSTFRIRIGKMDANHGILLLGNDKNDFKATNSGLNWQGDVRDIQTIQTKKGKVLMISQNNDKMLFVKL